MKLTILEHQITALKQFDGNLSGLVDGNITNEIFAGWSDLSYPSEVIVDLQVSTTLEKIRFYDANGSQTLKIETSKTRNKTEVRKMVFNAPMNKYNTWWDIAVTDTVRYVYFTMVTPKQNFPREIEIYGTPLSPVPVYTLTPKQETISKTKMGTCSGIWNPESLNFFGNVRLWFQWDWISNKINDTITPNAGGGEWQGVTTLDRFNNIGIKPTVVFQGVPNNIKNAANNTNQMEGLPAPYGADLTNPASYSEYIKAIVTVVKAYGTKCEYELINEWDKNWQVGHWSEATKYYSNMNPIEYITFLTECIKAMKAANPNIKIIMGGMVSPNISNIRVMADYMRDNNLSAYLPDAINFHNYSVDSPNQYTEPTKCVSPEDYGFASKTSSFVAKCNQEFPNIPVYCTEFGFGTGTSNYSIKGFTDPETVQGSWIVRNFLQLSLGGINKAYLFNFHDDNSSDKFATNGIITKEYKDPVTYVRDNTKGFLPKKSYPIVKQFVTLLKDKEWSISQTANTYTLTCDTDTFMVSYDTTTQVLTLPTATTPLYKMQLNSTVVSKPNTTYNTTDLDKELALLLTKYNIQSLNTSWK